jgi:deoxyribodipyrimidine photo-lyase
VGADWFWDTLVDADLASNSLGWQWSAGCGADAAPYFRIFNPVLQGEKFDAYGDYVRHYLPELQKIPNRYLHCPWEASATLLSEADIVLGKTYPKPLLLPNEGRQQALSAYAKMKSDF